jgi:hypothetical protein
MFSREGDALVAIATREFVDKSSEAASHVTIGEKRNELIEDMSVVTSSGETYDLYLGSAETVLLAEKPGTDNLYNDSGD